MSDVVQVAFQIAGMLFKLDADERSDALERVSVLLDGFGEEEKGGGPRGEAGAQASEGEAGEVGPKSQQEAASCRDEGHDGSRCRDAAQAWAAAGDGLGVIAGHDLERPAVQERAQPAGRSGDDSLHGTGAFGQVGVEVTHPIPVAVCIGGGLVRDFADWFDALDWLKHNNLSAEIVRRSDGVVLQRRVVTNRNTTA